MVDYLYSTKNYKKLLTDTNTSTDFIANYISGINYPGFTRYLVSENRKYTTEESYLYKLLEGEEIDIDIAARDGHLEVVKYLYKKGVVATKWGIDYAAYYGHLEVIKYLYKQGVKDSECSINLAAEYGHLEVVKYLYSQGIEATEDGIGWQLRIIT
jgi:hypothetical protein